MRQGRPPREAIKRDFDSKVVEIKRVTRVVAGGKRMRFRALVVIGDGRGRVGIGVKKGVDVSDAISKSTAAARKSMITVAITKEGSIPHAVKLKFKAAEVLLKPAKAGSGIIAGGPIRALVSLAGIKNISSKMLGSSNKIANVHATYQALKGLKFASKDEKANA